MRVPGTANVLSRHAGRIDERVAVHHAVSEELGALKAGNHAKHALLLGEREIRLESHQVVRGALRVLGAQLDGGPGAFSGAGVDEAHGLHRAEPDGVMPGARDLLGGLARLEELAPLEILEDDALRAHERIDEDIVLVFGEGGIQVVAAPSLVVARLGKDDVAVDGRRVHDGGRRVEEGQRIAAHQVEHLPGQGRGAERPRGDDARAVGYGGHLTTLLLDERDERRLRPRPPARTPRGRPRAHRRREPRHARRRRAGPTPCAAAPP